MNERVRPSVLITGAGGYLGGLTVRRFADRAEAFAHIVAMDLREVPGEARQRNVEYVTRDIRATDLADTFRQFAITHVVHLASIVTPGKDSNRELEYSVDVLGTENVLKACLDANVRHVTVSSSGAAYGYHRDNPQPLREGDALRGNPEFAYSDHKRLVEEMLARYRRDHPELKQLVLRPGTILGARTSNQITNLFDKRVILGVAGAATPFVFIWDEDVAEIILRGVIDDKTGQFNLAGDGTLTMREIAGLLGKPYVALPAWALRAALFVLKRAGLSIYGPEQVDFLRYRPVLANDELKKTFGYTPRRTTREAFEEFLAGRRPD